MSNDGNKGQADGESTYDRKQQAGVKKGSTFKTYRDGKYIGTDTDLKNKIEDQKEEKFIKSGAEEIENMKVMGSLGIFKEGFKKGSIHTRTYFSEKVLGSSKAKKNIGYTKAEFRNLSLAEQNKVYESYLQGRMQGGTDAYGNVKAGWSKDPTGNWVERGGGSNTPVRMTEEQITQIDKSELEKEEEVKISEDEYKKRRGLKGSRSMFGNAGGRGYFDPVT